jgi:hypothetical protein
VFFVTSTYCSSQQYWLLVPLHPFVREKKNEYGVPQHQTPRQDSSGGRVHTLSTTAWKQRLIVEGQRLQGSATLFYFTLLRTGCLHTRPCFPKARASDVVGVRGNHASVDPNVRKVSGSGALQITSASPGTAMSRTKKRVSRLSFRPITTTSPVVGEATRCVGPRYACCPVHVSPWRLPYPLMSMMV